MQLQIRVTISLVSGVVPREQPTINSDHTKPVISLNVVSVG